MTKAHIPKNQAANRFDFFSLFRQGKKVNAAIIITGMPQDNIIPSYKYSLNITKTKPRNILHQR
jgi:hypothetical protein